MGYRLIGWTKAVRVSAGLGDIKFTGKESEKSRFSKRVVSASLKRQHKSLYPRELSMSSDVIRVRGARQNNLKNLTLEIPLHELTVVTGVSG